MQGNPRPTGPTQPALSQFSELGKQVGQALAEGSTPGPHCRDGTWSQRHLPCLLSCCSLTLGEQRHVLRTLKQP